MAYYIWKSYKFNYDIEPLFDAVRQQGHCFFLDSSLRSYPFGRYSFLGYAPFKIISSQDNGSLRQVGLFLDKYKVSPKESLTPFLAGAVGFFSYDLGFSLEKKLSGQREHPDTLNIPDFFWAVYSTLIIIDHFKEELYLVSLGVPEKNYELAKRLAKDKLKKAEALLSGIRFDKRADNPRKASQPLRLNSNFTRQGYIEAVKKAKDYIRRGDIYQVNLSQQFQVNSELAAWEIYYRLRNLSPACYSGYLDCGDFQIISSSPEEFLRLNSSRVLTRPMKGTRRRSNNKLIDRRLQKELVNSPKDSAELVMIVDLEINDLGKVCDYHSIKVKPIKSLEKYSTVLQTTATVKGRLHRGMDRIDLIKACFPGGSITGCPKLRAMEIINELEPTRRNIYTGALGYLSFCGSMNLNIIIRTMLKIDDKVYFGVGSGIVADSDPEDEYEETLIKARAMIGSLSQ